MSLKNAWNAWEKGNAEFEKGNGENLDLLIEATDYLDNAGKSGIMKLGAENDKTKNQYDIIVDKESVAKETERITRNLGISMLRLEELQNATVLTKLVDVTESLQGQYGARYNAIVAENMPDGDIAYVNPSRELHINAKYFNSPDAMRDKLNTLMKKSAIPKGCNNISYVTTHEYMHLLTMPEIDKPHSEIVNLYKKVLKGVRNRKIIPISTNSIVDVYEFVADYLSLPWENKIKMELKKILGWS